MQPYYTIMRLPGEPRAEFIQMLPFTPRGKDNMAAWMVARSDGDQYGNMLVFQFPKQKVVFGPTQMVARINQDQDISPQISLWNQQGSEVIQGTLLVIPIEEALLYVRPLYLRASGGRIPELKQVIVAYQNQIVMEATLDQALNQIFGSGDGGLPTRTLPPDAIVADVSVGQPSAVDAPASSAASNNNSLVAQAAEHYRRALRAQRDGDWAEYGGEIEQLGAILERLSAGQN